VFPRNTTLKHDADTPINTDQLTHLYAIDHAQVRNTFHHAAAAAAAAASFCPLHELRIRNANARFATLRLVLVSCTWQFVTSKTIVSGKELQLISMLLNV